MEKRAPIIRCTIIPRLFLFTFFVLFLVLFVLFFCTYFIICTYFLFSCALCVQWCSGVLFIQVGFCAGRILYNTPLDYPSYREIICTDNQDPSRLHRGFYLYSLYYLYAGWNGRARPGALAAIAILYR